MELQLSSFETTIKNYLDNRAKEDKSFADKYANPNKSVAECCKYIYQQVEKSRKDNARCVACSSDEVFGMAVHYYDEDDIKVEGPSAPVKGVSQSPEPPQSANKPKERKRKTKAKETVEDPDVPEELVIPLF